MAQFILLLGSVDIDSHRGKPPQKGDLIDRYGQWAKSLVNAKLFREAQKLKDGEGYRVTIRNGRVVDGPFTETKETISSYFIIEAKDYEEALSVARECPAVTLQGGYVEVRAVGTCPGMDLPTE